MRWEFCCDGVFYIDKSCGKDIYVFVLLFFLNFLFFKSKYIIKKKEVNFNLFLFNIKCLNDYIFGKKIVDIYNCSGMNVYCLK